LHDHNTGLLNGLAHENGKFVNIEYARPNLSGEVGYGKEGVLVVTPHDLVE